eukprot:scaffold622503_cov21-Prasinocladus_malaysianus.AAC.1
MAGSPEITGRKETFKALAVFSGSDFLLPKRLRLLISAFSIIGSRLSRNHWAMRAAERQISIRFMSEIMPTRPCVSMGA